MWRRQPEVFLGLHHVPGPAEYHDSEQQNHEHRPSLRVPSSGLAQHLGLHAGRDDHRLELDQACPCHQNINLGWSKVTEAGLVSLSPACTELVEITIQDCRGVTIQVENMFDLSRVVVHDDNDDDPDDGVWGRGWDDNPLHWAVGGACVCDRCEKRGHVLGIWIQQPNTAAAAKTASVGIASRRISTIVHLLAARSMYVPCAWTTMIRVTPWDCNTVSTVLLPVTTSSWRWSFANAVRVGSQYLRMPTGEHAETLPHHSQ